MLTWLLHFRMCLLAYLAFFSSIAFKWMNTKDSSPTQLTRNRWFISQIRRPDLGNNFLKNTNLGEKKGSSMVGGRKMAWTCVIKQLQTRI